MAIERKKQQKVKGVAFNLDDDFDKQLLQHAENQGKFSAFVKHLIRQHMEGGGVIPQGYNREESATVEEPSAAPPQEEKVSDEDISDNSYIDF